MAIPPSRRRPPSGRGVQSLQDRRVRRNSHHRPRSPGACAPSAAHTAPSPKPSHWRAGSLLANFSSSHCPLWGRNGPRETSALCDAPNGRFRGRLGPETVADRDPGQRQMEGLGISATLRQRWSVHPREECVFGASTALRQALRDRPARRLGSLAATLAASSTPSQLNVFYLVLCDSSDGLSKALVRKGELVPTICLKRGPAYDVARNDVRGLVLRWKQAGWIRSLVIDYPDGLFHVARDQKFSQNTFHLPGSVELRGHALHSTCLDQCQFGTPWRKRAAVLSSPIGTHALARIWTFLVPPPSCPSAASTQTATQWPASVLLYPNYLWVSGPHPSDCFPCPASRSFEPCAPKLVFLTLVAGACFFAV